MYTTHTHTHTVVVHVSVFVYGSKRGWLSQPDKAVVSGSTQQDDTPYRVYAQLIPVPQKPTKYIRLWVNESLDLIETCYIHVCGCMHTCIGKSCKFSPSGLAHDLEDC